MIIVNIHVDQIDLEINELLRLRLNTQLVLHRFSLGDNTFGRSLLVIMVAEYGMGTFSHQLSRYSHFVESILVVRFVA